MEKPRQLLRLLLILMKLSCQQLILIGLMASVCLAKPADAQDALNQKVTIHIQKQNVKSVLNELQAKTNIRFTYSSAIIPARQKVSIDANQQPLSRILDQLFEQTDIRYNLQGRQIILRKNENAAPASKSNIIHLDTPPPNADRNIKGSVKDNKGEGLPGVSILVKGTQRGTLTDVDGNFQLAVPENTNTLIFSYLGFEPKEVMITGESIIEVTLNPDIKALNEVVVTGFGTQKKANVTGAITTVRMDEVMGDRPINNTALALQGSIPGLQITPSSGQPGQSLGLQIRGFESINGGDPLVLVDNVPMNINDINPRDIESVTVLKDAAASAIYGGRAAFGVVLISTKQGKRNQPIRFDYSTNIAFTTPVSVAEKVSAMQFVKTLKDIGQTIYYTGQNLDTWQSYLQDYKANPGKYPTGTFIAPDGKEYFLREHDIIKDFMGNGFEQLHNLSFTGGAEKSSYRVSLGYSNEDGILNKNKDSFKKINVNALLNSQLTKNLESSINIFYNNQQRQTPYGMANIFRVASSYGNFNGSGDRILADGRTVPYYTPVNMLDREPAIQNFGDNLRLFGKLVFEPVKDLKINGEYTFSKTGNNTRQFSATNTYINAVLDEYKFNNRTSYYRYNANTDYHGLNVYGNYGKNVGAHRIDLTAGSNYEVSRFEDFWAQRLDVLSKDIPSLSTSDNANMTNDDSFNEYAIFGAFGRLAYNYKDKYLFEANGRYDGSSRFARANRYGFFPSFSAGWTISEESFMKPLENTINILKVRASWGEIGNQVLSDASGNTINYPYIPAMAGTQASWINYQTSLRPVTFSPPALVSGNFGWETVRSGNIGLDLGMFRGKLNAAFDLFRRETLNMLRQGVELPAVLGTTAPLQNVANLESKGWEFNLGWKDKFRDLSYSVNFNLSDNRAFITRIQNESGNLNDPYYVGHQIGEIWGYESKGYYTASDFKEGTLDNKLMITSLANHLQAGIPRVEGVFHNPGDIKYADLNGDGVINAGTSTIANPGDRRIIGNNNRRFQFGLNGNVAYKGFDLNIFAQGVGKRDLWVSNQLYWPGGGIRNGL
jgi:TonB-linked SusC/RagA family outer membrane protein